MPAADNETIASASATANGLHVLAGLVLAAMMIVSPAVAAETAAKAKPRTLLIFAPDAANKDLARQKPVIAAQKNGLAQREIVVVYVVGKSVSAELGPAPAATGVKLRSHYKIGKDDFRVILLEKDDVKMTSDAPISAEQLFQTLDAVPAKSGKVEAPAETDGMRDFSGKLRSLKPQAEPRM
jgi:hypothetical protein